MLNIKIPSNYVEVTLDCRKMGPKMLELLAKRVALIDEMMEIDKQLAKGVKRKEICASE